MRFDLELHYLFSFLRRTSPHCERSSHLLIAFVTKIDVKNEEEGRRHVPEKLRFSTWLLCTLLGCWEACGMDPKTSGYNAAIARNHQKKSLLKVSKSRSRPGRQQILMNWSALSQEMVPTMRIDLALSLERLLDYLEKVRQRVSSRGFSWLDCFNVWIHPRIFEQPYPFQERV